MLVEGAIYRFVRTQTLRYYQAARTRAGLLFLFPVQVGGTRIADRHANGRRYVVLYFLTHWGKLAACGYWLDPKQGFARAYVTDATEDDLELVAHDLSELPAADAELDDILNRDAVALDMEVWGQLL